MEAITKRKIERFASKCQRLLKLSDLRLSITWDRCLESNNLAEVRVEKDTIVLSLDEPRMLNPVSVPGIVILHEMVHASQWSYRRFVQHMDPPDAAWHLFQDLFEQQAERTARTLRECLIASGEWPKWGGEDEA